MKKDRARIVVDGRTYFAAGVLPVCNGMCCVMISTNRGLELPGGKVELFDKDLFDTAQRETVEETNGLCKPQKNNVLQEIYDWRFKYALFVVKVDKSQVLPSEAYGPTETHTGVKREVKWIPISEFEDLIYQRDCKKLRVFDMRQHTGRALYRFLNTNKACRV
jgi:8-oxo-dGTP pyrophosphatase MutT (NUDIX family)